MILFPPSPRPWKQKPLRKYDFPRPPRGTKKLLERLPHPPDRIDHPRDQLDDPARDTRAQYYQDKAFWWDRDLVTGNAFEVARFNASPDQSGIVKLIWTYLEIYDALETPPYIHLDPCDPFSPQKYGADILWHLQLFQGTFQPIGPPWSGLALDIPGQPYPNLPRWRDQRFVWGRTAAIAFFLVPPNFSLRLIAEIKFLEDRVGLSRIGGRLIGYTQPIDVLATGENVKYGW